MQKGVLTNRNRVSRPTARVILHWKETPNDDRIRGWQVLRGPWTGCELTMGDLEHQAGAGVSRSQPRPQYFDESEEGPNLWTKKQGFPSCTSRIEGRNDREVPETRGNCMSSPVSKGRHE
jgi:hypothetical protein